MTKRDSKSSNPEKSIENSTKFSLKTGHKPYEKKTRFNNPNNTILPWDIQSTQQF